MIHSSQVQKSPFHGTGFTLVTIFRPYRWKISRLPRMCLLPATVPPTLQIMWIRYSRSKHSDMETTKLMWAKLIENGCYNNGPQISLITGNSKSLSGFTYIYHWDNKCFTCKALAGYRATRSPYKVQVCQIVQKLFRRFSRGLVSRLLGDEERLLVSCWFNNITCWMDVSSNATTLQAFTPSNGCSCSSSVCWIHQNYYSMYVCISQCVNLVSLQWKFGHLKSFFVQSHFSSCDACR